LQRLCPCQQQAAALISVSLPASQLLEAGEHILHRAAEDERSLMTLGEEALLDHLVHHHAQRQKISVDIEHAAWLGVDTKLGPRPLLHDFLKRTRPSREGKKGFRQPTACVCARASKQRCGFR